ncbi:MAG: hypothetical protein EOS73_16205 [Mesorhizobium sp.]|uniref:hypothetical protein n=1 Tax=Mesorhizobium sp. M7A.F.Ca.ET.027.02.1.1 TaxID=2496655 RepID=UPI000FD58C13|nr:hypothetical protein [Mesorhizobium sp. M7A.F.Ca.ET.027.02.1.1]RVD05762.1 hypothetical protein EN749_35085 [Mesorhizobium sp. M7A.F.Ca.ET.027.02.1.1]RWD08220.1 MAG: hypothetical protein EOS73_16205 [Mesorhizobium sp.]
MTLTHAPQPSSVRFPVQPRLVPAIKAARYLHLTLPEFMELLPALQHQGFPRACPITGNYDLVAIDAWQDKRSGLAGSGSGAQSSAEIARARLATLG